MTTTYWKPKDSFGKRLRILRLEKSLTTRDLGQVLGVHHKTISLWEHGSTPKNMGEVVAQLSEEYSIDPIWLMWGDSFSVGLAGLEPATERLWVPDNLVSLQMA